MSDAPPIQYCQSQDGTNIAWWSLGEGPPVLVMDITGLAHLALEWEVPALRRFYEGLATELRVIRYNPRSSGLSAVADDLGLDAQTADVRAVLTGAGIEQVALLSSGMGIYYAAPFADRHASVVSSLVALLPQLDTTPIRRITETVVTTNSIAESSRFWANWCDPDRIDPPEHFIKLMTSALPQDIDTRSRHTEARDSWDVKDALRRVTTPALVGHWDGHLWSGGLEVAALLPNAKLVIRKGTGYVWYDPEPESLYRVVRDFISEHADPTPATTAQTQSPPDDTIPLSLREREVIALVADGSTNAQIAEALVIAPGTVARHVSNLLAKTGLKNRVELTRYAIEHGLAGPHA